MRDKPNLKSPETATGAWVDAVANRALAVVAARKVSGQRKIDPELLSMMRHCLLNGERTACEVTVNAMSDAGVAKDEIADLYIPALARQLGEEWCDDAISFVDVTIGTSKLQALLRELGPDWRADRHSAPDAPSALVLVGSGEDHTLGAQVLAGRLRRDGFSVKVRLSADAPEIVETLERTRFDAVFISASGSLPTEAIRKLVDIVKNNSTNLTPVIVGGPLGGHIDVVKAQSGADLVTSDIEEALHFCGLNTNPAGDSQRKRRN